MRIVADTSAIVAFLTAEPLADRLFEAMSSNVVCLSAASYFEASMVIESRQGPSGVETLDFVRVKIIEEVVPVDEEVARIARTAFRRFGKGRHPAGLNFGDCLAYATAWNLGAPLLFVGNDFSRTDIEVASY